jgi:hypothetical protein
MWMKQLVAIGVSFQLSAALLTSKDIDGDRHFADQPKT